MYARSCNDEPFQFEPEKVDKDEIVEITRGNEIKENQTEEEGVVGWCLCGC